MQRGMEFTGASRAPTGGTCWLTWHQGLWSPISGTQEAERPLGKNCFTQQAAPGQLWGSTEGSQPQRVGSLTCKVTLGTSPLVLASVSSAGKGMSRMASGTSSCKHPPAHWARRAWSPTGSLVCSPAPLQAGAGPARRSPSSGVRKCRGSFRHKAEWVSDQGLWATPPLGVGGGTRLCAPSGLGWPLSRLAAGLRKGSLGEAEPEQPRSSLCPPSRHQLWGLPSGGTVAVCREMGTPDSEVHSCRRAWPWVRCTKTSLQRGPFRAPGKCSHAGR